MSFVKRHKIPIIAGLLLAIAAVVLFVVLRNPSDTAGSHNSDESAEMVDSDHALRIGDKRYSVAELNYEYMSVYNQYSQYAQYFGDVSPSAEYTIDEAYETWDDFYKEQAIQSLVRKESLAALAERDGVTLTDEETEQVDEALKTYEDYAKQYGYDSVDQYLSAHCGSGVTQKLARELMLRDALADKYEQYYQDNLSFTDEELKANYAANKDEYDAYSFHYYVVEAETTESTDADGNVTTTASAESMAAAKEAAGQIKAACAGDAGSFADAVSQYGAPVEQEVTESSLAELQAAEGVSGSNLTGTVFFDWLKDAAREKGDVEIFEQENVGYYVVLFEGRDDNRGATVNVRHILIQAEDADEDGVYSEEEMAAAKAKIEEIKAEWDAGAQTEDAFAALANQYSTDPGSNTNGGLYENVSEGMMITEFNDWCFDPARRTGDVGIIEDATYHGYHLMYFAGTGEAQWKMIAREALTDEAVSAFQESLTADVDYEILDGMRKVGIE